MPQRDSHTRLAHQSRALQNQRESHAGQSSQSVVSPPPAYTPSNQFLTLSDDVQYINRDEQIPWRRLTLKSMRVYEQIYQAMEKLDKGYVTSEYFRD